MPAVMGPPIVWLASDEAAGVHDERIVATEFDRWLRDRSPAGTGFAVTCQTRAHAGPVGGLAALRRTTSGRESGYFWT